MQLRRTATVLGPTEQSSTLSRLACTRFRACGLYYTVTSLNGVINAITWGSSIGLIKGDTRSLDYRSSVSGFRVEA